MNRQHGEDNVDVEHYAEELVTRTFKMCEKRLASARALTAPQKALSAAAMGVQQSVETFLAVSKIPDGDTVGSEK